MSRPNFLSPAVFPLNLHRLSRFKAHSSNKWCNENVVFCFPQTASCWQSLPGAMMYVIEKFRWNLVGFGHCAPLISRWNPEPKNCWFGSFTIKHPGQVPNDQRTLYACYHWFVILYLQVVRSLHWSMTHISTQATGCMISPLLLRQRNSISWTKSLCELVELFLSFLAEKNWKTTGKHRNPSYLSLPRLGSGMGRLVKSSRKWLHRMATQELAPGIPSLRIEWYTWYTPATPRNMSRFQWRINLSLKVFNPLTNISGNPKTWIQ